MKVEYIVYFGLWLNKDRAFFKQAAVLAYGVGVGIGVIEPPIEYYRAISDGEGQARLMKARADAARALRNATS